MNPISLPPLEETRHRHLLTHDSGMTGASSADATPTDQEKVAPFQRKLPPAPRQEGSPNLGRSASPRVSHARSPTKSIEKTSITRGSPDLRRREVQSLEELRSSSMAYRFLRDAHSHFQSGYTEYTDS